MSQMIHNYIAFELAGIWELLLAYGLGAILIAGCLAAAYFTPWHKKDFLYAAGILAIVMVTYTVGVSSGEKRVRAQCDVEKLSAVQQAKDARLKAQRSLARKPSRWLPNHQQGDPDCRDC